jgi:hypothetical protein
MPPRAKSFSFEDFISKPMRNRTYTMDSGDNKITVKVQAIGSKAWEALIAEHPAPKGQKQEPNEGPTPWDKDTFPAALISACVVEPAMTVEQAQQVWDSDNFSLGEKRDLFQACIGICQDGLDIPLQKPAAG